MILQRKFASTLASFVKKPAVCFVQPFYAKSLRHNYTTAVPEHLQFNRTEDGKITATLFEGHGIGPEISRSVIQILDAAEANIAWEKIDIPAGALSPETLDRAVKSVLKNKLALKGPLMTPVGKGYRSINITLRQALQLYANVRPAKSIPAIKTGFHDVDVVVIRENTEGEYSGLEHEVVPGVVESLKVITKNASMRIAEYAFQFAKNNRRKQVTAVHKATVHQMSDGLFLECCREVSKKYPDIIYEEKILDRVCMNMVQRKREEEYDVIVTPNLYGDILSDLCAGLIGGLGLTGSGNYGEKASLFEAVHGSAPDIAGKDLANPTALLLSAVMMLRFVGNHKAADTIEHALHKTFREGKVLTGDLGGKATTTEFTNEVIKNMSQ